jgi:heme iron utilization protein
LPRWRRTTATAFTPAKGAIPCVSKPFMGLESHSVRFYNEKGEAMFAVYVGREGRALIPSVREGFMALRRETHGEVAA